MGGLLSQDKRRALDGKYVVRYGSRQDLIDPRYMGQPRRNIIQVHFFHSLQRTFYVFAMFYIGTNQLITHGMNCVISTTTTESLTFCHQNRVVYKKSRTPAHHHRK